MTFELPKNLTAKDIGLPSRRTIMKFIVEILSEQKDGLSSAEMTKRIIEHFELETFQIETMNSSGNTTILKRKLHGPGNWLQMLVILNTVNHKKSG